MLGPPDGYHPDTSTTDGTSTSRLDMARVANLSVEMFGKDSRYYGKVGVVLAACGKQQAGDVAERTGQLPLVEPR